MEQAKDKGPAPPEPMSDSLVAFSGELAQRFPGMVIKRFVAPAAVTKFREIFIRELRTRDTIEAAIMADGLMEPVERASVKLAESAEERETHRISIVGLDDGAGYRHVNNGAPFAGMNEWPKAVCDLLKIYFNQVNGLAWNEVASGIAEARVVGAFAPPSATLASASLGRLAG